MGIARRAQALVVSGALVVALACFAGCGGGGQGLATSTSSPGDVPAAGPAAGGRSHSGAEPQPHPDPVPKLHIATFGTEADSADRKGAEVSLLAYLNAYEDREWSSACRYLASKTRAQVLALDEAGPGAARLSCGQLLALVAKGTHGQGTGRYATRGVSSLRYKEEAGFAIFTAAGGTVYWMPMRIEEGRWKVIATTPTAMR